MPGLTLAEEVSLAVAQAVEVCDTVPVPPGAVTVRDTVGLCVMLALTVPLLAALREGEGDRVPLWGLALAESEGESVAVWQGEAEREEVGVTVPVAVPLPGVAVGEVEALALVQCVGEAVALAVMVRPPEKVELALSEAREEMEALRVADCVALVEAVVEGLGVAELDTDAVSEATPDSVEDTLMLGDLVEELLAVGVEEREKVGVAVAEGVEKLPGEAVAARLPVARRLPVAPWQAVAGAEGVKLEETEAWPDTEGAAEAERVKVGLTEGGAVREAVAQAVVVAEALVVSVARALVEGLRGVLVPHTVVVGDTEPVREGEEDTLGEGEPVGSAPVGVVVAVELAVMGLPLAVAVVEEQGVVLREKEVVALAAGEKLLLGLAVEEALVRALPEPALEAVALWLPLALPEPPPTPAPPPGEAVVQLPMLGVIVVVCVAVEDQDLVPVGVAELLVVGQALTERWELGEAPALLLAAAEPE